MGVEGGSPQGELSPQVTEGWPSCHGLHLNHPSPPNGGAPLKGSHGASGTPPPTNYQKAATNNRNYEPPNRRVLAPGRGQSVRSWILKGALAKRSRKARTQAPLSRAPRLGSSGTFLVLFWSQKSTPIGQHPTKKGRCRKVATPVKSAIKNYPKQIPIAFATFNMSQSPGTPRVLPATSASGLAVTWRLTMATVTP